MLKRLIGGVAAVILAAGVLMAADGTWRFPVPGLAGLNAGDLIYAVDGHNLSNKALTNTDGSVFLPAVAYCKGDTTNLTPTRLAANNWALARTATGAETINVFCSLDSWLQRTTANTGIKVTSLDLVYQIATNLTSHTWGKVAIVTYATGAANSVGAALDTAVTLATAATTNPQVQAISIGTQAYFPTASQKGLGMEWQAVLQNTGQYRVYGVNVSFTRTDH